MLARARPVVRAVTPRVEPVGREIDANVVSTAPAHDGAHGGVDAVDLADVVLCEVVLAALEDRVRAEVPDPVLGHVHGQESCSVAVRKSLRLDR